MADVVLAASLAASLLGSGIGAVPYVGEAGVWVALILDDRSGVVAWLDLADMTYVVTVEQDGTHRLVPSGR